MARRSRTDRPGAGSDSCKTTPTRSLQAPSAVAGSCPRTQTCPSLRALPEAFEDLNRRGLTRAVRAEEGEDLSPSHLEINARDRIAAAVALNQAAHADHRL